MIQYAYCHRDRSKGINPDGINPEKYQHGYTSIGALSGCC